MSQRVSYSLIDPWVTRPLMGLYGRLPIPRQLPPEAIVLGGHVAAIAGAVGFALSANYVWAGVLAAVGVALNHTCDVLDGTHARATGQCRNGGELLDHFVDPLSFSYWATGLAVAASGYSALAAWIGVAGVIAIYATAVLTNIRAKMVGEFTLARFGPTEFKSLLVLFGLTQAGLLAAGWSSAAIVAFCIIAALSAAGVVQLLVSLFQAVRDVNELGAAAADTTEWEIRA
jgi:archaetidylinositol phosphate synthase